MKTCNPNLLSFIDGIIGITIPIQLYKCGSPLNIFLLVMTQRGQLTIL